MGASLSTSNAETINNAYSQTYQSARNECNAECNQIISGNVIVLDGSTAGDIQFTQRCTADASCYMKNALEQVVSVFQLAEAEADAQGPLLNFGINISEADAKIENNVRSELTQVLENICNAEVNQTIQDNIVYATDSTLGNIGFVQEGNAQARCVMENAARMQLALRQEGKATATSGNLFGGLIGIIAIVVIIIIVIGIVRGAKKKKCENGKDEKGQPCDDGSGAATGLAQSRRSAIPGRSTSRTSSTKSSAIRSVSRRK